MVCEPYLNKALAKKSICQTNMNPKAQIAILTIDKIEFKANVDFKTR